MTLAPPRAHPPAIVAVTDRRLFGRTDQQARPQLAAWAAAVAEAGVDAVHIRERGLTDATLLALVREVLGATSGTACRILVNERLDIALAAGAAGVHLPAAGLPPDRARRIAPDGFMIGRSVHSLDDAAAVEQAGGCDYLVFGTVFETASKPASHQLAGLVGLRTACESVALPVLAIGGVSVDRADDLAQAGAAGAAAIGLFAEPWLSLPRDAAAARLSEIVAGLRSAFASTWHDAPLSGGRADGV